MARWLLAVLALALAIAAGYLAVLNQDQAPVTVRLAPERTVTTPLATALLAAFAGGGLLVGLVAGVRAGARGWRRWRSARRARREAARAAVTAHAQELVWAGDYVQARHELLRAERGAPPDPTRLLLLAETHLQEGDPAGARTVLEEGLTQVAPEPRLLDLLAEACERTGDLGAAGAALERARQALPASPRLARRLRDLYAAAGRWPEALVLQGEMMLALHDPAALAAEQAVLHGLRYEAALAEADARRAARLLVAIAREDPGFVPAWVTAGDRFVAAKRAFSARRAWERGARHTPAVVLLERIERLDASEGRPERTLRVYRRLLRRHPDAPSVRLLLARLLIGRDALEQADQTLAGLPPALAGLPLPHALWGEIHRRRGNLSLAAETLARSLGPDLGVAAPFRCAACRRTAEEWTARCEECRRWGTYRGRAERLGEGA